MYMDYLKVGDYWQQLITRTYNVMKGCNHQGTFLLQYRKLTSDDIAKLHQLSLIHSLRIFDHVTISKFFRHSTRVGSAGNVTGNFR